MDGVTLFEMQTVNQQTIASTFGCKLVVLIGRRSILAEEILSRARDAKSFLTWVSAFNAHSVPVIGPSRGGRDVILAVGHGHGHGSIGLTLASHTAQTLNAMLAS